MAPTPFYVAGRPESSDDLLAVTHPADGRVVGQTSNATPEQVERAVAAAADVAAEAAALPAHVRAAALDHVSAAALPTRRGDRRLISAENGKPLKWARGEVGRAVSTFRFAAEEARRFGGEAQRLDTDPAATGRLALTGGFPRAGARHRPFNFPLNLVAHKIAPAIAVGRADHPQARPGHPASAPAAR